MSRDTWNDDVLLGEAAAADVLGGLSTKTLQAWRTEKRGPRFVKLGDGPRAPVRYRLSELRRWLQERERAVPVQEAAA